MTLTRRTFGIGASGLVLGSIAAPFVGRAGAAGTAIRIGVINSMSGSLAAYAQEGQPAFDYIVNIDQRGRRHQEQGRRED